MRQEDQDLIKQLKHAPESVEIADMRCKDFIYQVQTGHRYIDEEGGVHLTLKGQATKAAIPQSRLPRIVTRTNIVELGVKSKEGMVRNLLKKNDTRNAIKFVGGKWTLQVTEKTQSQPEPSWKEVDHVIDHVPQLVT